MLLIVWQLLVPGAHTVTVTFGMLTKFCAPGPTVIATVFDAVAAIGWALGVLPEFELEPPLFEELLSEPLLPPPQAVRKTDRLIAASQRGRFKRMNEPTNEHRYEGGYERDEETVGHMVEVSIRYLISLALTPAGNAGGR